MSQPPTPRTTGDVRQGLADALQGLSDGSVTVAEANAIARQAKKDTAAIVKAAKAALAP
jgi:hypothetical protein